MIYSGGCFFIFIFLPNYQSFTILIKRISASIVAPILLTIITTGILCLWSPLALTVIGASPSHIQVSQEEQILIEKFVKESKPVPKSRLSKSTSRLFSSQHTATVLLPTQNISLQLPILMYHKTPINFESQLQHLTATGYSAITMRTASRILRGIEPAPPKPVVITFDDGYSDQLLAFELLKKTTSLQLST